MFSVGAIGGYSSLEHRLPAAANRSARTYGTFSSLSEQTGQTGHNANPYQRTLDARVFDKNEDGAVNVEDALVQSVILKEFLRVTADPQYAGEPRKAAIKRYEEAVLGSQSKDEKAEENEQQEQSKPQLEADGSLETVA